MNESINTGLSSEQEKKEAREVKKQRYIFLAKELSKIIEGSGKPERFEFKGIKEESRLKIEAETKDFPEYSTPIGELIEKFKSQGMKIVLSKDPESGNVYVLPFDSENVEMDSLFPRHLIVTEDMDVRVKELISINLELKNS